MSYYNNKFIVLSVECKVLQNPPMAWYCPAVSPSYGKEISLYRLTGFLLIKERRRMFVYLPELSLAVGLQPNW